MKTRLQFYQRNKNKLTPQMEKDFEKKLQANR